MIGTRRPGVVHYVYSEDPAIDKADASFNFNEYFKNGGDKHLPIKPDCQPTRFELAKLTRRQFLSVLAKDDHEKYTQAVAYGLRRVEHFTAGSEPVTLAFTKTDLGDRVSDDCLEKIYAPELFTELGLRIISLSQLDPTIGRG